MTSQTKPYIGGQALIEGVMMRAPGGMSVAVRRPDGSIVVQEGPLRSKLATQRLWKLPGFRGVATLVEALSLGWRALSFSAEQQMTEEERQAEHEEGSSKAPIFMATALALALFIALPQVLASGTGRLFGVDFGLSDPRFHLVIGAFKMTVVLGYLVGISMLPDVRRTFQYHGAEHKTINAYERGLALTVENVRAQTTLHPRCGTTFLIVVVFISVIVGSVAAPLLLPNAEGPLGWAALLVLRIGLLPLIAAISYELQRLSARYCTKGILRVFLYPGFLVQKISTREPDDRQIEIAITAMKSAEWRELQGDELPSDDLLIFPDFEGFLEALPKLRVPTPAVAA